MPIDKTCKLFGRTRQAYYKQKVDYRKQREKELKVIASVREIRQKLKRLGGLKLWEMMKDIYPEGWVPGRDRFYELLRQNKLLVPIGKSRHTTNSNHRFHKYRNLIKDVEPMRSNEIWVADITYVEVEGDTCYLHIVTDAYSRMIIGWVLTDSLAATCTHAALLQAIAQTGREDLHDVIHHSDRGTQYCCDLYVGELKKHGIMISMTEGSNPTDNGIAERVNGIIKQELIYPNSRFRDMEEAREMIGEFIDFYNKRRPHMSLKMQTPSEVHGCQTGVQKRCWKTYRKTNPKDKVAPETV